MDEHDNLDSRIRQFLDQTMGKGHGLEPRHIPVLSTLIGVTQGLLKGTQTFLGNPERISLFPSQEKQIRQEIADHLKDLVEQELENGRALDEAWAHAIARFGDIDDYVGELEEIHRLPIIQWLTRLAGLGLTYWILHFLLGLSLHTFLQAASFLAVILMPSLAALIRPGQSTFTSWRFWSPRLITIGGVILACHMEGGSWELSLLLFPVGLAFVCANQDLNSHRLIKRMGTYSLINAFLLYLMGIVVVLMHLANPSIMGEGLAVAVISLVYGIIFGRPSWRWTTLFALATLAVLYPTYNTLQAHSNLYSWTGWTFNPKDIILSLLTAMILGWTFFGKSPARHWLPAAGLLTTIILQISIMSNLINPDISVRFTSSLIPFVSLCLIAIVLEIKRRLSPPRQDNH